MQIITTVTEEYATRIAKRNASSDKQIWNILDEVCDPELPGLTIWDLGVLQDVSCIDQTVKVVITPTYSGCPAVDTIINDIKEYLGKANYKQVNVEITLSPAWSTDMMSPAGKQHLKSIHIAPPNSLDEVNCPVCGSKNTKLLSQFGSTACKSLHQCNDCFEAFDYFKHF